MIIIKQPKIEIIEGHESKNNLEKIKHVNSQTKKAIIAYETMKNENSSSYLSNFRTR